MTHFCSYYVFCVGSRSAGLLRLGIQARLHETTLTAGVSNLVKNEIQRIDISGTIVPERQVNTCHDIEHLTTSIIAPYQL